MLCSSCCNNGLRSLHDNECIGYFQNFHRYNSFFNSSTFGHANVPSWGAWHKYILITRHITRVYNVAQNNRNLTFGQQETEEIINVNFDS